MTCEHEWKCVGETYLREINDIAWAFMCKKCKLCFQFCGDRNNPDKLYEQYKKANKVIG